MDESVAGYLVQQRHEVDARLERAMYAEDEADDLRAEVKRLRAIVTERDHGFAQKQVHCGHPVACIYGDEEGTVYCAWCVSLDQARREGAEAAAKLCDAHAATATLLARKIRALALEENQHDI